jgi:dihydrofolate reductase
MGKVFVDVGLSLDGFLAGPNRGPANPLGDGGTSIHGWLFKTATFLELLGMAGGEASADDRVVRAIMGRAGAYVMGKRMFEEGEVGWPDPPPFRAPVFVLSHAAREAWPRKGGTTFQFVTDGIESALAKAKAAAGGKDVRISGGADTIRQYLRAGLVDEIGLHIAPVLIGEGLRLLEGMRPSELRLEQQAVTSSPLVTHIGYRVLR